MSIRSTPGLRGSRLTGGIPRRRLTPEPPVAAGYVYAPCTGRAQYLVLVEACPWCGEAHHLRCPVHPTVMRRRCPLWGRRYDIVPRVRRAVHRVA